MGVIALGVVVKSCSDLRRHDKDEPAQTPSAVTIARAAEKLQADFNEAVRPCDSARKAMVAAVETDDPATAYSAAREGERICNNTWQAVQQLAPPQGAAPEVAAKFETALKTCAATEFEKKASLDRLQEALDSGMLPSKVADFREVAQSADAGIILCAAQFHEAVELAQGSPAERAENARVLANEAALLWKTYVAAASPCDLAQNAVGVPPPATYQDHRQRLEIASAACATSAALVDRMEAPAAASDRLRGEWKFAIEACRGAASAKQERVRLFLEPREEQLKLALHASSNKAREADAACRVRLTAAVKKSGSTPAGDIVGLLGSDGSR